MGVLDKAQEMLDAVVTGLMRAGEPVSPDAGAYVAIAFALVAIAERLEEVYQYLGDTSKPMEPPGAGASRGDSSLNP
jgi:hypothetical protein